MNTDIDSVNQMPEIKICTTKSDDFDEQWNNAGSVQRLITLLWISLIISTTSDVLGAFDVRYYYSTGFLWNFAGIVVGCACSVWLIVGMMHFQNWARNSFIVLSLLIVSGEAWDVVENGLTCWWVDVIGFVSIAIDIWCVALCFSKEVRQAFSTHSWTDRLFGWLYWLAFIAFVIGMCIIFDRRKGSEEWDRECKQAMLADSREAKERYVNYLTQGYLNQNAEDADAEKKARGQVDKFLRENESIHAGINFKWRSIYGILLSKAGKAVAAGIFVFVGVGLGGSMGKRKKKKSGKKS